MVNHRKTKTVSQRLRALFLFFKISFRSKSFLYLSTGTIIVLLSCSLPSGAIKNTLPFPPSHQPITCQLKAVVDGDTIIAVCAKRQLHIRLLGIDAPEMAQEPWGKMAKIALNKMLPKQFLLTPSGSDYYHRQLGIVYVNNIDINLRMIEQGFAVAYQGSDTPIAYKQAEENAQIRKLGVWHETGEQQNPKLWRRKHANKNNE